MQRHAALEVPFATPHVGSTEATLGLDTNTFGARLHGRGHRAFHGTPECDATFELVGDAACKKLGIKLRFRYFDNVEFDVAVRQLLKAAAEPFGFRAATTDDHAGTPGVDVDLDLLVTDPLYVDPGDRTARQFVAQVLPDLLCLLFFIA